MNSVLEAREPSARYLATLEPALLQQFDLIASAPKGVARLRELILTLAVQGKLVPQDPNEEPASALLERIRAEKARLAKAGKIKKDKPLVAIAKDEMPFGLPSGWDCARLADIVTIWNGRAYSKPELLEAGTPVLRVGNLFTSKHWYYSNLELEPEKYCEQGDLLFAWSASFGPFVWAGPRAIYHYHIWKLEPFRKEDFNRDYLYTFLLEKTQEIKAAGHGVSMLHMTKEKMEKIVVPFPPLTEQSRIVARVDELMALCDSLEAKGKLETVQHARLVGSLFDSLASSESAHALTENWQRVATNFDLLLDRPTAVDALEQTILQLAVRGLLVPQNPADEPASVLLQKIRTEKKRLIASGQLKRDKHLPPISEEEKPFELPEGWEWVRMPDIAQSRLGKMLDAAKNSGTASPYLRNTNLQWRKFNLSDIKEIYLEPNELAEYRLLPGDLLICEGGEPGRCAVWMDEDTEMYFQKALHRVRPFAGVSSEYLATTLEANVRAGRLDELFTGATIKHFTGQALERYVFALPPLAEQSRIVARIAELRVLCVQLRDRLAVTAQTQSRLAATLIEKAVA